MIYVVKCAACNVYLGKTDTIDCVDSIALDHDRNCPATEDEKQSAAFELRLRHFTAQEGLGY